MLIYEQDWRQGAYYSPGVDLHHDRQRCPLQSIHHGVEFVCQLRTRSGIVIAMLRVRRQCSPCTARHALPGNACIGKAATLTLMLSTVSTIARLCTLSAAQQQQQSQGLYALPQEPLL